MVRALFNSLIFGVLILLAACGKAQLESDNHRLQDESKQLKEKVETYDKTLQQTTTKVSQLERQVHGLLEENRRLKDELASSGKTDEQRAAQGTQQAKQRPVIDPDQYKAQLKKMVGWTRQQVAQKLGNPQETLNGGDNWFYKFDAQDGFGVVYRHIQINFDASGRVNLATLGQMEMSR